MTRTPRLTLVLLLNLPPVAGLVVAGISAHSVGVLAAGGDYLADAAAIGPWKWLTARLRDASLQRKFAYALALTAAISGTRPTSTKRRGRASRSFMSGSRECPPARNFASSPPWATSSRASSTELARL